MLRLEIDWPLLLFYFLLADTIAIFAYPRWHLDGIIEHIIFNYAWKLCKYCRVLWNLLEQFFLPETAMPGQPRKLTSHTIVVAIKRQLGQDKDEQDGFHGDDAHHVVYRRVLVVTVIRNVHRYQSLEQFAMKSSKTGYSSKWTPIPLRFCMWGCQAPRRTCGIFEQNPVKEEL